MGQRPRPPARARFGVFEVDPEAGELRKQGTKVRLPDQSFQILLALLERPGEVVTRRELQERLWQDDTFVDFDANLNTAVSLLRDALGDSAKSPRFIETLPRRGYRFLADVVADRPEVEAADAPVAPSRRFGLALLGLGVVVLGSLSLLYVRAPAEGIETVAVLPLVYAGPQTEGDHEYLADGITSSLITELVRLGIPNVISETSVMRYKAAGKSVPEIARELGADVLVEGSVVREGGTVRVNAQLIDARHDRHIWARSYRKEMRGLLDLQDEIARAIVREIRIELAPAISVERTVNPKAHEAYLKGRYALRSELEERRSRAREFFEQAIELDPMYAPAYLGLAEYYGFTDAVPPDEALASARRYALKALELDETLAGAHLSLAQAALWGDWDWTASERAFTRSLELAPADATTLRWYALFLDLMGRPRAARVQLQRLQDVDPVSPHTYYALGFHDFVSRRYEDAIAQLQRVQELSPHDPKVFEGLASLYRYTGRAEKAIAMSEQGIALWGRDPAFLTALTIAHARAGHHDAVRTLRSELDAIAKTRHIPPCWFAMIEMALGDHDRAFEWLDAAFKARDVYLVHLNVSPDFDAVRGDARFQDLVRRMKFPRAENPIVTSGDASSGTRLGVRSLPR